ncbi:hypothetical protein [Streptomyces albiflavescens]|nr:hypothetical protein [Streptomyces albiflavescens]
MAVPLDHEAGPAAAYSPTATLLAAASSHDTVQLWNPTAAMAEECGRLGEAAQAP